MSADSGVRIQSTGDVDVPLGYLLSEYGRSHASSFATGLTVQTVGQTPVVSPD